MKAPKRAARAAGVVDNSQPFLRFCPFDGLVPQGVGARRIQLPTGQIAWEVGNMRLCRSLLASRELSAEHSHPNYPSLFPVRRHRMENGLPPRLSYSGMDGEEHELHRSLIADEFSARRVAAFRPTIERIARRQVQALAAGPNPTDLVTEFAQPLTVEVVSEWLGVPSSTRGDLERHTRVLMGGEAGSPPEASLEFRALLADLLTDLEAVPPTTLIGRLIDVYRKCAVYDRAQMVEFVGALIAAGYETTVSMIVLGAFVLMREREALAAMLRDDYMMGRGVDELLRYLSVGDLVTTRTAIGAVPLGGFSAEPGDAVVIRGGYANRDATAFARPEAFDLARGGRGHVAFGHGAHVCLGQHLARAELAIAFATLFKAVPGLAMESPAPPVLRDRSAIVGTSTMRVCW